MTPRQPDDHDDTARGELAELLGARGEDEAIGFADAAAELAMQLPPAAPHPDTKAALFARIDALGGAAADASAAPTQPEEAAAVSAPEAAAHTAPRTTTAPGRGSSRAASTRPPSRRESSRYRRSVLVITSVAAALALFFAGFASRGLFAGPPAEHTASAASLAAILAQPDALHTVQTVSTGGTATLVWSEREGRAAIILNKTGPAPSGKTYELWFLRSGVAVAAGTLNASATSPSARQLTGRLEAGDQVAITIEPAAGTRQPTTNPIVVIPTSST